MKGSGAMVRGRLQTRSWDDQDSGKKMYRTEIIADEVIFGSKRDGNGQNGQSTHKSDEQRADDDFDSYGQQPADNQAIEYPDDDISPEDIPF